MTIINDGGVKHGEKIGVLMLDINIPRPPGDIGNAGTFAFPIKYRVVKGASVKKAVKERDPALIEPFVQAAKELEEQGVQAITTSCGFLTIFQKEIQREINIPFYSSSLMQIPFVYSLFGQKGTIGVLTARKSSLGKEHFEGAGINDVPLAIEGMDDMVEFTRVIIDGQEEMNMERVENELIQKANRLVGDHLDMKAVILECTNMPPYKKSIKKAVQLPVFDIVTLTEYVYASLP